MDSVVAAIAGFCVFIVTLEIVIACIVVPLWLRDIKAEERADQQAVLDNVLAGYVHRGGAPSSSVAWEPPPVTPRDFMADIDHHGER